MPLNKATKPSNNTKILNSAKYNESSNQKRKSFMEKKGPFVLILRCWQWHSISLHNLEGTRLLASSGLDFIINLLFTWYTVFPSHKKDTKWIKMEYIFKINTRESVENIYKQSFLFKFQRWNLINFSTWNIRTIDVIFIVILPMFLLIYALAFFRCFILNLRAHTESWTEFFIWITGVDCFNFINHDWAQVLCYS